MSEKLRRSSSELADTYVPYAPIGVPGKVATTSRLVMRRADANGVAPDAGAAVDRAASSSGHALPADLRGRFESSLGADLSSVRVHTGAESADAARAVGAKAYTTGQDIHFAEGLYDPTSAFGVHLLAHEVAHTVQQRGGAPTTQHKLEVSAPQDAAEIEADRAADAMVAGEAFAVGSASSGVLRREPDPVPASESGPASPASPSSSQELNWAAGGGGPSPMTSTWNAALALPPPMHPVVGDEERRVYAARTAVHADWQTLQSAWNSVVPHYQLYSKAASQAEAVLNDTNLDAAGPGTGGDDLAAATSKAGGGRKVGDSFDGGSLETDPELLLNSKDLSADDARKVQDMRVALKAADTKVETARGKCRSAANANDVALNEVAKALNVVAIKNNDLETAKLQEAQQLLDIQKAEWVGVINAMTSVSKGLAKADWGEGLAAGGKLLETSANKQYSLDIQELKSQCNSLKVDSSNREVANAMLDVDSKKKVAESALNELEAAVLAHETALTERRAKFREMSAMVETLATSKGNASPEEAAKLQVALQAIPVVEEVLPVLANLEAALGAGLPSYTADSGRGAAMASNGAEMQQRYGTIMANRTEISTRRGDWQSRVTQLRQYIDSL